MHTLAYTPHGVWPGLYLTGGLGGLNPLRKFLTPLLLLKKRKGGRLSMYLCISTVVDFNSQNFDPPLMKFDKYSPEYWTFTFSSDASE